MRISFWLVAPIATTLDLRHRLAGKVFCGLAYFGDEFRISIAIIGREYYRQRLGRVIRDLF